MLTQRMLAWAITAAVVAAVIGAGATMLLPDTPAAGDRAPRVAQATPTPTPTPTPEEAEASGPDAPVVPKVATRSARLEDVKADEEPAPTHLRVESIGISDSPIDPVGIEPDGAMEIPTDVSRIGWYEYGPSPGAPEGSAVLTAHIDSRTQGQGVFYHLDAMTAGDLVEVGMSDGTVRTFQVDEVRQIPKVDLPTGSLFRRDGKARLALITCGGEFDSSSRHYLDNLVVLASPTD